MNPEENIIWLYLRIEAAYRAVVGGASLRKAGFEPGLSDVEALVIEIFGEWQGHHGDKAIWRYCDQHWREWFPQLSAYKTFTKHCANLRWIKEKFWLTSGRQWMRILLTAYLYRSVSLPAPAAANACAASRLMAIARRKR